MVIIAKKSVKIQHQAVWIIRIFGDRNVWHHAHNFLIDESGMKKNLLPELLLFAEAFPVFCAGAMPVISGKIFGENLKEFLRT